VTGASRGLGGALVMQRGDQVEGDGEGTKQTDSREVVNIIADSVPSHIGQKANHINYLRARHSFPNLHGTLKGLWMLIPEMISQILGVTRGAK